jgi:hypothetical protein
MKQPVEVGSVGAAKVAQVEIVTTTLELGVAPARGRLVDHHVCFFTAPDRRFVTTQHILMPFLVPAGHDQACLASVDLQLK